MDNREIDAKIGELLGWRIEPEGDAWRCYHPDGYSFRCSSPNLADLDDDWEDRLYGRYALPPYSSNIAAEWEMEESLVKRGVIRDYVRELVILNRGTEPRLSISWPYQLSGDELFALIHADPRQRCLAALRAVGVEID